MALSDIIKLPEQLSGESSALLDLRYNLRKITKWGGGAKPGMANYPAGVAGAMCDITKG